MILEPYIPSEANPYAAIKPGPRAVFPLAAMLSSF